MDCGKCQKEHEYRLENLDKKMDKGEQTLIEHKIKIEKTDESTKSAHLRINEVMEKLKEIGEIPQAILRISLSIESMTDEIKELAQGTKEHQKEISERVSNLEKAPGKQAYDLQRQIIVTIILSLVGFALGKWGIK